MERRDFLGILGTGPGVAALTMVASTGLAFSAHAATVENAPGWNKLAFEGKSLAEVAKGMGATSPPVESKEVILQAPEIAENGAVVRIVAQSNLPYTTLLAMVVDKNPSALAAVFDIPAGTDPTVSTNIKMGESSRVYALAKVGDKFYYAVKEVKVTLGGCGG